MPKETGFFGQAVELLLEVMLAINLTKYTNSTILDRFSTLSLRHVMALTLPGYSGLELPSNYHNNTVTSHQGVRYQKNFEFFPKVYRMV